MKICNLPKDMLCPREDRCKECCAYEEWQEREALDDCLHNPLPCSWCTKCTGCDYYIDQEEPDVEEDNFPF